MGPEEALQQGRLHDLMRAMEADKDHKACLNAALRLLGRKDHTLAELAAKLGARGFSPHEIQWAVSECVRLNYLNDEKFAADSLRRLRAKGYGCRRIRQMLLEKGFQKELVEANITACCKETTQHRDCLNALLKKIGNHQGFPNIDASRPRLFRFLLNRGFSAGVINDVMKMAMNPEFGRGEGTFDDGNA